MRKFYLVFLNGNQEPIPINGTYHTINDGVLNILDEDGDLVAYFQKDKWIGFSIDYVQQCEHNHQPDLPEINQPNTSGH